MRLKGKAGMRVKRTDRYFVVVVVFVVVVIVVVVVVVKVSFVLVINREGFSRRPVEVWSTLGFLANDLKPCRRTAWGVVCRYPPVIVAVVVVVWFVLRQHSLSGAQGRRNESDC
jgi:hypothetical protein